MTDPSDTGGSIIGPARDLKARVLARIRTEGPLSIAAYMADALYDVRAGYYATKDPIGAGADFITAPEISAMFGEVVGLWCVQAWMDMGEPADLRLIELGPGRGTLLADILRAGRVRPNFLAALKITLVEASPALQAAQADTLKDAPVVMDWARDLPPTGAEPCVILANEFLDCLPIRQFVRLDGAWRERLVGVDPQDAERLAFVFAATPASPSDLAMIPDHLREADEGAVVEVAPALPRLIDALAQRLTAHGGRALLIDYGPADGAFGDTLQAVRAHQKVDPLDAPGETDLTARVDFGAVRRAAAAAGLDVAGPVEQGGWLLGLGLEQRAAALMAQNPDAKARLASQMYRLTDPAQMGAVFKVICLSAAGLPPAAGFA